MSAGTTDVVRPIDSGRKPLVGFHFGLNSAEHDLSPASGPLLYRNGVKRLLDVAVILVTAPAVGNVERGTYECRAKDLRFIQ